MCAAVSNTLLLAQAGITIRNGRLAGLCVWGDGGGGQSQVMDRSLAKVSVAASSRGREIDHCPLNVTSGQTVLYCTVLYTVLCTVLYCKERDHSPLNVTSGQTAASKYQNI